MTNFTDTEPNLPDYDRLSNSKWANRIWSIDQTIDLAEYEEGWLIKNRELIWLGHAMQDAQEEGTRAASMEEVECFEALKQKSTSHLPPPASELNITKEDLWVNDGVGIHDNEEFENALVGWCFS